MYFEICLGQCVKLPQNDHKISIDFTGFFFKNGLFQFFGLKKWAENINLVVLLMWLLTGMPTGRSICPKPGLLRENQFEERWGGGGGVFFGDY